jgi:hypothetical protein
MASGDVVGVIYAMNPTATTFATPDSRPGGSTPAEAVPVWDFDDTNDEYIDVYGVLATNYSGGGLTVALYWSATSATTGNVVWRAAIRRIADDAEDVDTSQTYDFNSVTATTANVSGEVAYDTITFTSGADMDSLAAGEQFILRITRQAGSGSDSMTGDAELHAVVVRET